MKTKQWQLKLVIRFPLFSPLLLHLFNPWRLERYVFFFGFCSSSFPLLIIEMLLGLFINVTAFQLLQWNAYVLISIKFLVRLKNVLDICLLAVATALGACSCCYIEIMYFPVVVNNCLKSGWSGISNVLNSEIIKTHLNFYLLFSLSFCSTFFLLHSLIFCPCDTWCFESFYSG